MAPTHIYVTSGTRIRHGLCEQGALTFRDALDLGEEVGALTVHPAGTHLYVAMRPARAVASVDIDPRTGVLRERNRVDLGAPPIYLHVDRTGTNLLAASFDADVVMAHRLAGDGALAGASSPALAVGSRPHAIVTSPDNRFAFVPHRDGNIIRRFRFTAATGELVDPRDFAAPEGAGPRHMVFHPDGHHVYVVDEFANTVTTYAYDVGTGALAPMATVSTLPDPEIRNGAADIHVTRDGRYVYASNRGHDSIAIFAVEPDHTLARPCHVATPETPRAFELDPSGRYLYAAGQQAGVLEVYAVVADGALRTLGIVEVGPTALWVLAILLPGG